MTELINKYVEACDTCLRAKPKLQTTHKELKPNKTPERRWGTITMDFVMPLPKSEGHTGVLVVVDQLTKMVHFIPVARDISVVETAEAVMRNIVKIHGLPNKIISD